MPNKYLNLKILFLVVLSLLFFLPSSLFADQNISVTGSVAPTASDFQAAITSNAITAVSQGKSITYTITYGSHLYYAGQLTVEAQWYQGTIQGAGAPSVDVVNYVTGSATNAYNSTTPVVDLVNQKIRWTISSFPSQTTNQAISFTLKTSNTYQGTNSVTWPVKVRIITPSFTTTDQSVTNSYIYDATLVTPTPTSIPQPTATPTPGKTATTPTPTPTGAVTPTPTTKNKPFGFSDITFRGVSFDNITLIATTNQPSKITTRFGTSPNALAQSVSDTTLSNQHNITLLKLNQLTTYYVVLTATSSTGQTVTSEIYNFKTGQKGDTPQVEPQSVTFISSDVVLYTPKPAQSTNGNTPPPPPQPVIVVPQNVAYNFRFQVSKPETVKRVQAIVRNKNVLGITSADAEEPNTIVTDLIETQSGIFEGRLQSPSLPGSYEEYARIYDTTGNIEEHKLADIQVSQPFRVYNQDNQQPIEAAQIYFYYFNTRQQAFLPLPPQLFPVRNPSYTNLNGQIILPLPTGQYKAVITAIGYKEKTVTFTLGADASNNYPAVLLAPEPFNLITVGKYYFNIIADVLGETKNYIQSISYSVRFFDLNAVIATAVLVFLTLLAFSSRIHVPLRYLGSYFLHFARVTAAQRKLGNQIKGRLFDKETGTGVNGAHVYLIDSENQNILSHTESSKSGEFLFKTLPNTGYDIQVMADSYEPVLYRESEIHAVELQGYLLTLTKRATRPSILERMGVFGEKLLSLFFEALLILSFVFELSLGAALGFDKTFLFLLFSGLNLLLWIIHMTHLHTVRKEF